MVFILKSESNTRNKAHAFHRDKPLTHAKFFLACLHFSTMNSWISIPVCRAPPCILSRTSSPTLSEVTGIAVLRCPFPDRKEVMN